MENNTGFERTALALESQRDEEKLLSDGLWSGKNSAPVKEDDRTGLVELTIDSSNGGPANDAVLTPEAKDTPAPADTATEKSNITESDNEKDLSMPQEAGPLLFKLSENAVNQSIYKLPRWAQLAKPAADLGCVSSFSNRYREALKTAGIIDSVDDKQYRSFYQVNMDELNKSMGLFSKDPKNQFLRPVSAQDAKEGDIIQGMNRDTHKRHMGIVGAIENGERMVYHNFGGTWSKDPLVPRFEKYKELNYYRVFLPSRN